MDKPDSLFPPAAFYAQKREAR